jgi:two-component system, probable response regulator PhcQ
MSGPTPLTSTRAKPVVLFVDDEPALLESITLALRRGPFETITAASARDAMKLLETTPVDIVVSDERMPGMSGTEFLSRVRQSHPYVVRIALTGESDLGRTAQFIRHGEVYWMLSKPVQREELLRTLERAMGVKRLAEEGARLRGDGKGRAP